MELVYKKKEMPGEIVFNFEELKGEIAEAVKQYTGLAYTDEQMQQAKTDRAKLRKFIDVLDQARKAVKAEILAPYNAFEAEINELKSLIDEPVRMIDGQIKEYEEKKRFDKEQEIIKLYQSMPERPIDLILQKIWKDKWLNVTYSMKQVEADIKADIEKFNNELAVIERLNNPIPARITYLETMDLNKAIAESDKQDEIEKRKAEEEQRRIEAEQKQAELIEDTKEKETATIEPAPQEEKQPARQWVSFKALLAPEEALMLKKFFDNNGIHFEPIA